MLHHAGFSTHENWEVLTTGYPNWKLVIAPHLCSSRVPKNAVDIYFKHMRNGLAKGIHTWEDVVEINFFVLRGRNQALDGGELPCEDALLGVVL